jgi:hypothetical protein
MVHVVVESEGAESVQVQMSNIVVEKEGADGWACARIAILVEQM